MSESKSVKEVVEETPKAKRELSAGEQRTDAFKVQLQSIIKQRLDIKVSKETAWALFKDLTFGTLQFVLAQDNKVLSLSGVGRFEVIKAGARGAKKEAGAVAVPKYRFYPSTSIEALVSAAFGMKEIPEGFEGLGVYAGDEALDNFASMVEANKAWLEATEAPAEEE